MYDACKVFGLESGLFVEIALFFVVIQVAYSPRSIDFENLKRLRGGYKNSSKFFLFMWGHGEKNR